MCACNILSKLSYCFARSSLPCLFFNSLVSWRSFPLFDITLSRNLLNRSFVWHGENVCNRMDQRECTTIIICFQNVSLPTLEIWRLPNLAVLGFHVWPQGLGQTLLRSLTLGSTVRVFEHVIQLECRFAIRLTKAEKNIYVIYRSVQLYVASGQHTKLKYVIGLLSLLMDFLIRLGLLSASSLFRYHPEFLRAVIDIVPHMGAKMAYGWWKEHIYMRDHGQTL